MELSSETEALDVQQHGERVTVGVLALVDAVDLEGVDKDVAGVSPMEYTVVACCTFLTFTNDDTAFLPAGVTICFLMIGICAN